MTEDDIIDMAKESDMYANSEWEHSKNPKQWKQCRDEYFADILTSTEREACALLAQQFHIHRYDMTGDMELHEFIRARSQS